MIITLGAIVYVVKRRISKFEIAVDF